MEPRILVVDDEPHMVELIQTLIKEALGCQPDGVAEAPQVLSRLAGTPYDLVLLDLRMPEMDGMTLLKEIKTRHPATDVVIVTAYGSIPTAVEAMQQGALEFLTKPFSRTQLLHVVDKALRWRRLNRENRLLRKTLAEKYDFTILEGLRPESAAAAQRLRNLAGTDIPVFLTGEAGTGKSHLSKAIHYHSQRAGAPFVELVCSSLDASDLPGALFGCSLPEGGYFPGAIGRCHGGTLYLADIHALDPENQGRIMRLLEEDAYEPCGSLLSHKAEVRLVLSSDQDLMALASEGRMAWGLYHLLERFRFHLLPLRERREDLPALVTTLLERYARIHGRKITGVSQPAMEILHARDWPGNLRELENTIERAVVMADSATLEAYDILPLDDPHAFAFKTDARAFNLPFPEALKQSRRRFETAFERHYLLRCLLRYGGDLAEVAAHAALDLPELEKRLARMNLSPEGFPRPGAMP